MAPRPFQHSTNFLFYLLLTPLSLSYAITLFPSNTVEPRAYNHASLTPSASNSDELFRLSCPNEHETHPNATVLFSSSNLPLSSNTIYPSSDSFVRGVVDAWAQHQHLVLRPEEVWFAILVQMNFYMSSPSNSESLRHLFVPHSDREEIQIVDYYGWEALLLRFKDEIQARVKTDWLLSWIMPGFSTTTEDDEMVANVLMMGLMKGYFEYSGMMICGLPSITLLGTKDDWQLLLRKLDRLPFFGEEPKAYAQQLQPILSRFVKSFDDPDGEEIRLFWNSIIHASPVEDFCGLPPYYLTGWLMGFYFWDKDGSALYPPSSSSDDLVLDGITYARRAINSLPIGYAQAPFTMKGFRNEEDFPTYVLAGNIAKDIRSGLPEGYADALRRFNESVVDEGMPHGILEPRSGWMVYGPAPYTNTTKQSMSEGDESAYLSLALDRSYMGQYAAADRVKLGVENVESVEYNAFGHRLQQAIHERNSFDWYDELD